MHPKLSANRYISRFLLVSLNIDAILQETTIHRRRQKLNSMTDGLGLGDAYSTTLGRIKGQGGEKARLGMAVLMWISHAKRPLKPDELCHALAVEIGSPNLNTNNIPPIGTLLSCCQGLVVVDKEASIIRLMHFTLQEYLLAHPQLFGAAHSTIAETCLSYLNSQEVKALPASHSPDFQSIPFFEYSSLYWGIHAKRELSDCAKLLALKLFDDFQNHPSIKVLVGAQKGCPPSLKYNESLRFSGLHCASRFGIDEIVANLVEAEDCDINQKDSSNNTPLVWAARNGHEGTVKILLGRDDINPDQKNFLGQTPLHYAAKSGYEGVVKILLGRDDVNPNNRGSFGQTPLNCAAENGHEGVVKILLGRDDVSPDNPGFFDQTPLHCAAQNGHESVVKILLGRDGVSPNIRDWLCETPLELATRNSHTKVIALLQPRKSTTHSTV